jgi:putative oxidoreductase
MDLALLLLRLVVGLYLAAHGAQKLFGWFGGPGLAGTQAFIGGMLGFRPARVWTLAISVTEFGAGLLMALGLLGPIGPIGVAAATLAIIVVAHWANGPWNSDRGYELPLTNLAVAIGVGLAGPGAYALDRVLGLSVPSAASELVALLSLIGVIVALATRRTAAAQPQTQPEAA